MPGPVRLAPWETQTRKETWGGELSNRGAADPVGGEQRDTQLRLGGQHTPGRGEVTKWSLKAWLEVRPEANHAGRVGMESGGRSLERTYSSLLQGRQFLAHRNKAASGPTPLNHLPWRLLAREEPSEVRGSSSAPPTPRAMLTVDRVRSLFCLDCQDPTFMWFSSRITGSPSSEGPQVSILGPLISAHIPQSSHPGSWL